jgi:diadenosine tetraphosphate (Ap4A) HIT family hydrolase
MVADGTSHWHLHMNRCPFCALSGDRIVASDGLSVVFRDGFPISLGHTLIIPRRHIGSFFEATPDERASLLHLLDQAQQALASEFHPDGWNIGINDGPAAGQTVPHLHIHLIPRYTGDSADPRGGVRWVIPGKANYWDSGSGNGNP